ncbi:MAG: leucine-rich repeat domain-containing protein [Deltaproteobacteria bacterium]|nr:leucine-rich repeat domain-containing protein [Deltaproteobacteria bacterium]
MKGIELFEDEGTAEVEGTDADLAKALGDGALDEIENLVLGGRLTAVPSAITRLKRLKRLDVTSGKIKSLPAETFELATLETLGLSESKIATLPAGGWGRLVELRDLQLTTDVTALPDDLGDAPLLGGPFDLAPMRKLATLPESFGRLAHVTELRLPPKAKSLPSSIAGMSALTMLDVSERAIAALPDDLGRLPALAVVRAVSARLKALPESLGDCASLTELHLGGNQLTAIPDSLGRAPKLQVLDVSGNPLGAVPESLAAAPALRKLGLHDTRVTTLPPAFARTALTKLTLPAANEAALRASSGEVLQALGDRVVFY